MITVKNINDSHHPFLLLNRQQELIFKSLFRKDELIKIEITHKQYQVD